MKLHISLRWPKGLLTEMIVRQRLALALPPVLVVSMWFIFRTGTDRIGPLLGYFLAFLIYWIGWCLLAPAVLLGGSRQVLDLFQKEEISSGRRSWKIALLLLWPLPFPLLFRFLPQFGEANGAVVVASVLLGVVTGVTEEVLWRGVYVRLFPRRVMFNTVYPSVMFALWHLAPQAVHANPSAGGVASFVLYALALGLSYATYARKRGSIRWCTVSHCVHDILGLGGFAYVSWLG